MWEKILQNKKLLLIGLVIVLIVIGLVIWIILRGAEEEKPSLPKQVKRETPQELPKPSALPGEIKPVPQETQRAGEEIEEEPITPLELLIGYTPYYTAHFSIQYLPEKEALEITLYATLNRADQYPRFLQELKAYKQEALEWIANFGVDLQKINIIYIPEEAKDL